VEARLFTIPASHPGIAAALMLDHKGIAFKRTDLMPVISKVVLRGLGFPRQTVPALKIDGDKIQGSRSIARELERLRPEPALFPADPAKRAAVEEAERFGDERLQHPIRQLLWWTIKRDKSSLRSYSEGAKLGVPIGLAVATGGPIVALSARFNEANDETARSAINALPGMLDKVDGWIADGVIGGEEPNAADLQIAPTIRLMMVIGDARALIEGRPCAELALRLFPQWDGDIPAGVLPAASAPVPAAAPSA
jgi:glutathione S-transferase